MTKIDNTWQKNVNEILVFVLDFFDKCVILELGNAFFAFSGFYCIMLFVGGFI